MRSASDDGASRARASGLLSLLQVPRADLRGLAAGVAFLAVLELLLGGFLLPAIRQPYEGEAIIYWTSVLGTFSRNLSAILGVALASFYVAAFVRDRELGRPSRRLTIAVLAVLAIPVQGLALLVRVTPEMVFMSYAATYFLCLLTVLSAIRWPCPVGMRVGLGLVLLPVTAGFLATVVARLTQGPTSLRIGLLFIRTLDLGGEALVVGVSCLLPLLLVRPAARSLRRAPGRIAALLALLPSGAYVAVEVYGADRVDELTQATMGLEMAFWSPLYLVALFAFTTTVLVNLLPEARPDRRGVPELGLGLVLVAAAGQDTHTPFRLVLLLLGFQLLAAGLHELREPRTSRVQ